MDVKNSTKAVLSLAAALALTATLGGCEGQDPVRWGKNIGDYLNLRNSFLDPSQVGRFDKANPWGTSRPVTWPILEQLDVVDEPNQRWTMATDPVESDTVVEQKEYVVGEGDDVIVTVFELVSPGMPFERRFVVNELGNITTQNLGSIHVAGLTPTQIEEKLGALAVEKGFLLPKGNGSPGPQVTVQVVQSQERVFSILGQVSAPSTYTILRPDFRLLDALAFAHDIPGGTQPGMEYLYVIRQQKYAGVLRAPAEANQPTTTAPAKSPLEALDKLNAPTTAPVAPTSPTMPTMPATAPATSPAPDSTAARANPDGPTFIRELPPVVMLSDRPTLLAQVDLDQAIGSGAPTSSANRPATAPAAPPATPPTATPATGPAGGESAINQAVGGNASKPGFIFVQGKGWVEVAPASMPATMSPAEAQAAATGMTPPRVIRIPIDKLKEGYPQYNIVIRPGDVINVPNIEPGEFYLLGHVGRPGVYTITGRKVTLKQAIAASGGLDALAIPRRCDLIRRIGTTEVTVQVDLQRIFDGEQPDIFLKANDLINVGTDAVAPFLAVTRNAYRAAYGWGFTYDRNFYNQPVISQTQ